MLTLEVLHVCRQIDEYTHLIASIKAQIKLVRTVYYTYVKNNKSCILASHVICLSSDVPRLSTYSLQFHMQVCEGIRELLQQPPETEFSRQRVGDIELVKCGAVLHDGSIYDSNMA